MKILSRVLLLWSVWLAISGFALAQSGRVKDASVVAGSGDGNKAPEGKRTNGNESRTAAQLYEDANNYAQKKIDDFEKHHMPYDGRLADKIREEQRDLAARYATQLAARKLAGQDTYYLGMLHNL